MKLPNIRARSLGFTLVELLVVLAIIGLLAGLVGPRIWNSFGKAQSSTAAIQIKDLEQAVELFRLDVGRFPNSREGLQALNQKPASINGWNGPYLKGGIPQDPWGNDYHYELPSKHGMDFDIYSLGADNSIGGDNENADIGNWQKGRH